MLRLLRHSCQRIPLGAQPFSTNSRSQKSPPTLLDDTENGFGFIRSNPRDPKPRTRGVTEIRASYYNVMGKRCLADVLETMGHHVDGLKFGGGSFTLYPEAALREMIDLCHEHNVYVSTGGFMEHLLTHTTSTSIDIIDRYLRKCKDLGFDVVEISTGFLSLPTDDWARLIEKVQEYDMKPKPELGIQFGAGGDTSSSDLESLGQSDPQKVILQAKRFFDLGVERIMIESEGITENVVKWRTDVISALTRELPMEKVMFEAADPPVFTWYIREFGIDVNLFIDHSQIVQLSALRSGIWGTADTFGRIVSYRPDIHVAAGRISSAPKSIPSRNKK